MKNEKIGQNFFSKIVSLLEQFLELCIWQLPISVLIEPCQNCSNLKIYWFQISWSTYNVLENELLLALILCFQEWPAPWWETLRSHWTLSWRWSHRCSCQGPWTPTGSCWSSPNPTPLRRDSWVKNISPLHICIYVYIHIYSFYDSLVQALKELWMFAVGFESILCDLTVFVCESCQPRYFLLVDFKVALAQLLKEVFHKNLSWKVAAEEMLKKYPSHHCGCGRNVQIFYRRLPFLLSDRLRSWQHSRPPSFWKRFKKKKTKKMEKRKERGNFLYVHKCFNMATIFRYI